MNSKQRHYLRGLAHSFKPVVNIGKNGITEGTIHSIHVALNAHELIKVKIKGDKKEFSEFVTQKLNCYLVGSIGNIVTLFRQNEKLENRKIKLP